MSTIWFCSDLHLGHKNIGKFRAPLVNSEEENNNRIITDWKNTVGKRDTVYVLGDFCFDYSLYSSLNLLGRKFLVRGNHDNFSVFDYELMFEDVLGLVKYKEFWLSHAPIHPDELRGKYNLHGHVHYQSIKDPRYFNCCPENLWTKYNNTFVSLEQVRQHFNELNN